MITFRPFINTDPPAIASIWSCQPPIRGRLQRVSVETLEQHVFAKPYFDREGLIVAVEDDLPIGFIHASFGPDETMSTTSSAEGVICHVLINPRWDNGTVRRELLELGEKYLIDRGAMRIHAGGFKPNDPFYLGLYGGSRLPGILTEEPETIELFRAAGFQNQQQQIIMQCPLDQFQPRVDRRQMLVRRKYQVNADPDPPAANWWEACTLCYTERTQFELFDRTSQTRCGEVTFWDMQPLSDNWGTRSTGIFDLRIEAGIRRNGLATYLVSEAIKQLIEQGITLAEVQTAAQDAPTIALFEKLQFHKIDEGVVLVKDVA